MPVVFVHGVNDRPGPSWDEGLLTRRSLFRQFMLPSLVDDPAKVTFHDPMWGPLAANFRWDQAALPSYEGGAEALGPSDRDALEIAASSGADFDSVDGDALLQTARLNLVLAVDTAWAASAQTLADEADAEAWAELGRQANAYAGRTRSPAWLQAVTDDTEFVRRLQEEVEAASAACSGLSASRRRSRRRGDRGPRHLRDLGQDSRRGESVGQCDRGGRHAKPSSASSAKGSSATSAWGWATSSCTWPSAARRTIPARSSPKSSPPSRRPRARFPRTTLG